MRSISRPFLHTLALCAFTATLIAGCGKKNEPVVQAEKKEVTKDVVKSVAAPTIEQTKAIAEEGFIYGLPLVMNYAVMNAFAVNRDSGQFKAPFNQIHCEANVFTHENTAVVTPNSDTPYCLLWVDLRAEPMVVSVPAVPKSRYYSVHLCDGNTFNYGFIGTRTTGPEAGDFLIVGPDWNGETPAGIKKIFRSSTQQSIVIFRTQLFNPADLPGVAKVQAGYKAQPLSAFLNQPPPAAAPAIDFPKIDDAMLKANFFDYLDFVLAFGPPGPDEKEIRARLASIGVGPGRTFDFKDLSPEHKAAVLQGMKEGDAKVDDAVANFGKNINGWNVGSAQGDRSYFDGNWLLRAVGARAGIYGLDAVEATYPMTRVDAAGGPLDSSKHAYTLTFAPGKLPPVNAFWSITMYDGTSQLLVKNAIDRYLINSPMLPGMKKNKDGSLTLYIQKDSPGKAKESNWLPAPNGPMFVVMRLYWPKETPPSIFPLGEGTWAPPGIIASK